MEALGINIPGLATSVIIFVVLFFILKSVLYKPLLRVIDQRSARIKESIETAQTAKDEAQRSQEEMGKRIEEARAEGQAMISQAREVANRFKDEELAKAKQDIEAQKMRAESEIRRERDAAIEELRSQFANLAITAAERVVRQSVDESTHRQLIDEVLKESSELRREA